MPRGNLHDSVVENRIMQQHGRNVSLLYRCEQAWNNLEDMRLTRDRTKRYCYSDQWGDTVDVNGVKMTEREYLQKVQASVPLVNNIMISILNSVVGLYAKQGTEPVAFARTRDNQYLSDMMSATLQCNWQNTKEEDLLKHIFEDSLMSGVSMVYEEYKEGGEDKMPDAWTEAVNPNYAFWEGGSDPRHNDFSLIGVLHDVCKQDLYSKFTKYGLTIDDLNNIFHIDSNGYTPADGVEQNDINSLENVSFYTTSRPSLMYRVIEVWTKETKPRYQIFDPIATNASDAYYRLDLDNIGSVEKLNKERAKVLERAGIPREQWPLVQAKPIVDEYWYYSFLAPDGTVLCEGETPYDFHSHPFTVKLFPYTNGEIHPFMSSVIDQQRYINRLIMMNDLAIRSSAKGMTIVPTTVIPDNMSPEEFAEQWTSYRGLIFYTPSVKTPNARPELQTTNAVNIGTNELLQIELNLIRDISNVSGALQGKTPSAGTSASRYSMETQNATTSLYSILKDFSVFTESIAMKKCQMIQQFYEDGRFIINKNSSDVLRYDRLSAEDVKFKISIKEAAATAAYQTQVNDQLEKLLEMGQINLVQYLENISAPYADSLLQSVLSAQQQAQQTGQMPQVNVPGANQQTVQQAQQMLQAPQPVNQNEEGGAQ